MGQRSPELVQNLRSHLTANEQADVMPAILFGTTTKTAIVEALFRNRDLVLRAARHIGRGIVGLVPHRVWRLAKVYGIPLSRYVDRETLGSKGLHEKIKAKNEKSGSPRKSGCWAGPERSGTASMR